MEEIRSDYKTIRYNEHFDFYNKKEKCWHTFSIQVL